MRAFHEVIAVGEVVVTSAIVRRYRLRSPSRPRRFWQNSSMVAMSSRSRCVATWYMSRWSRTSARASSTSSPETPSRGRMRSQSSAPALRVVLSRAARVRIALADVVQQRREKERHAGARSPRRGGRRAGTRARARRARAGAGGRRPTRSERRRCTRGRRRGARAPSRVETPAPSRAAARRRADRRRSSRAARAPRARCTRARRRAARPRGWRAGARTTRRRRRRA